MAESALQRALAALEAEERWVERCGGNILGYIANYGSVKDGLGHYSGDGGEAIYAADMAALNKAQERVKELLANQRQRGHWE